MRIICAPPYDFWLSWSTFSAFSGRSVSERGAMALWWEGKPVSILLRQTGEDPPTVEIIAEPFPGDARRFQQLMRTMLNADLELEPFYRKARRDKTLRPVVNQLLGLKPVRPPDIFQMMVIALTEQQISMNAARRVRDNLVENYGYNMGRLIAFPRSSDIASLQVDDLRGCGLSSRKAEYLLELARKMESGEMGEQRWEGMTDEELIRLLRAHRGMGEWTAEYIMVRGLGRMDVVPASDLGVRRVVGKYLAGGEDLSAGEVRSLLEPWSPWRGLVCFYLLTHHRMSQMGLDQAQ
jgi:DNA-3-methyladenine glycosylase II